MMLKREMKRQDEAMRREVLDWLGSIGIKPEDRGED